MFQQACTLLEGLYREKRVKTMFNRALFLKTFVHVERKGLKLYFNKQSFGEICFNNNPFGGIM